MKNPSVGDPNKDPFMKGIVPIYGPSWTGSFPAYTNVLKDKIDMVSFPHADKTGSVLETAMFLSGSAKTKYPKEVAEFINFFINTKEAADILGSERGIPENKTKRSRKKCSEKQASTMSLPSSARKEIRYSKKTDNFIIEEGGLLSAIPLSL